MKKLKPIWKAIRWPIAIFCLIVVVFGPMHIWRYLYPKSPITDSHYVDTLMLGKAPPKTDTIYLAAEEGGWVRVFNNSTHRIRLIYFGHSCGMEMSISPGEVNMIQCHGH